MTDFQITYEGDVQPSAEQVRFAVECARQVGQAKSVARLSQLSRSFEMEDGTQVYVTDLQHVRRVHIVPVMRQVEEGNIEQLVDEIRLTEDLYIVGFVSGAAHTGLGQMVDGSLRVKNDSVSLVGGKADAPLTRELFSREEVSFKVAVERHVKFQSFSEMLDGQPRTQLAYVLPGLYTGAMAPIVQLLLGVGKRLFYKSDYPYRWLERTNQGTPLVDKLHIADDATHRVEDVDTIADVSDAERFVEVPLRYDYRWNRTHGVVWGDRQVTNAAVAALGDFPQLSFVYADRERTREPFLIEVGQRGIYAMPLPRDPMSFYDEARDMYRQIYSGLEKFLPFLGDDSDLFEALGGFPTGDCFPENTSELLRWVRAGFVVKADMSLSDFYSGSYVSTAHGWAFADSASMATAVTLKTDERGLRVAECWLLEFTIRQKSQLHWNQDGKLIVEALGLSDFIDTFKAFLLTDEQVEQILYLVDSGNLDAAKQMFDEVEVSSWWTIKVGKSIVARGYIDSPGFTFPKIGCYANGRNLKYFEPVLGKTVSFDFYSENLANLPASQRPQIDGPIFSVFVGNDLEILFTCEGYSNPHPAVTVNTRQPCQYTGSWEEGIITMSDGVFGNFYTSSKDLRKQQLITAQDITKKTAYQVGRMSYAAVEAYLSRSIWLSKHVLGYYISKSQSFLGHKYRVTSAAIASNSRSAFFIKTADTKYGVVYRYSRSNLQSFGVTGTQICGSIYHFIVHWAPGRCSCNYTHTWKECFRIVDPENCFGDEPPDPFFYSVGGETRDSLSALGYNNAILGEMYYTPFIKMPPGFATETPPKTLITEHVYGFGLPEIHGKLLKKSVDRDASAASPFSYEWEMVADIFKCESVGWYVLRNYYGAPFMRLSVDWDVGPIETFGAVPDLKLFTSSVLFGIVE